MRTLFQEYLNTLHELQQRREQLASSIGENIRRVQTLDEEIGEIWDALHAIKKYL